MKIELWPIDKPQPYARNARKISDLAIEKVARSIKEFGWQQAIVVDGDGVVIAGHTRLLAAKKLGEKKVPVSVAADLTPEQVKAYRLADNRSHEEAEWDLDMLGAELFDLKRLGFDLGVTAFDEDELAELMTPNGLQGDEDAVPEPPKVPVSQRGQVWLLGRHRLMCGDSTDGEDVAKLMDAGKADMVFTDPPYGVSVRLHNAIPECRNAILGDDTTDVAVAAHHICAAMGVPLIFWGANHYAADALLPNAKCWLCWDKQEANNHNDQADCEFAWTNIDSGARIFHHLWAGFRRDSEKGERRVHPTQKPVALIVEILDHFKAGKAILDLFGGSGSTLIACEKTNRSCYMMEMSEAYADVIITRWEQATGKKAVLASGKRLGAVA
jgi:ParB-like chromosome segregation protein Spo0J